MNAIMLGAVVGLLVAGVGAWKDTMWEEFRWRTFLRSPVVTAIWAALLSIAFPNRDALLVALASAALERLSVEAWKGLIRRPPSKFARSERDTRWVRVRFAAWQRAHLGGDHISAPESQPQPRARHRGGVTQPWPGALEAHSPAKIRFAKRGVRIAGAADRGI
jgi:hypothetical protein